MSGDCTSWAFAWRIERRDGVAVGLTSHDRDLFHDGMTYRGSPGMTPAAISLSASGEPGSLEAAGALSSNAISVRDLGAGRWDGARVTMLALDWMSGASRWLAEGELGALGVRDGAYTAELRGAEAVLDAPATETTSPDCRALLGDRRCRVPMATRRHLRRVVTAADASVTLDVAEPAEGAFAFGTLRWLTGANGGIDSAVLASAGAVVTLREPPPFAVGEGERVELIEGCDKRLETCRSRFGNVVNFRGEPYLPGIDLLTRYPGM